MAIRKALGLVIIAAIAIPWLGCSDSGQAPRIVTLTKAEKQRLLLERKMADVDRRLADLVPTYAAVKERLEEAVKAGDVEECARQSEKALFLNKDLIVYLLRKSRLEQELTKASMDENLKTLPAERTHLIEAAFTIEENQLAGEYKTLQGLIAAETEKEKEVGKGKFIEFYRKSNEILDRKEVITKTRAELLEQDAEEMKPLLELIEALAKDRLAKTTEEQPNSL